FPNSVSLPVEFHDQIPAGQVQQEGKDKDQYSLATGQVIVGVLVLIGFGKVIEHVVKKAWNAIGMLQRHTLAAAPLESFQRLGRLDVLEPEDVVLRWDRRLGRVLRLSVKLSKITGQH